MSGTKEGYQKGREAAIATKLARSYATGYRVGDAVTAITPKTPRIHGRKGHVVTTNLGEVGVTFTKSADRVDAWFLPIELTK